MVTKLRTVQPIIWVPRYESAMSPTFWGSSYHFEKFVHPYHRPLFHVWCYYRLQHNAHIYASSKTPTWPPIFLKESRGAAEKYSAFLFQFMNNSWFDQQIVKEFFQHDGIFVPPCHFNLRKFLAGIAVLKERNDCVKCWQLRQNGSLLCLKWCKNRSNRAFCVGDIGTEICTCCRKSKFCRNLMTWLLHTDVL